jgi:hypothetical protein
MFFPPAHSPKFEVRLIAVADCALPERNNGARAQAPSHQKHGAKTIGRWYWRYLGIGRFEVRRSMIQCDGQPFACIPHLLTTFLRNSLRLLIWKIIRYLAYTSPG